jgi:arylsulfatase A-like enzyme
MKRKIISIIAILILITSYDIMGQSDIERPTNILCILVDDLGFGDLSCQGAKDLQTPYIDAIAKKGVTFSSFYANCTVCSPSRASLLSGKYPDMVGVPGVIRQNLKNNWGYLQKDALLLPEVLKKAGYHTALVGKWHLGLESPNLPNERGFDLFRGFLGDMMDDYWTHLRGGINWMRYNNEVIEPQGHATDIFTDWSLEYLKMRDEDKEPFFLYLAYNAPHFPIQPPKEFLDKVKAREREIPEKRARNVAFIEHLDYSIGRILEYLEETGLIENTLLVFTSDNGGSLPHAQSNGKLRGGKQDMYEGGIRVPTFMRWDQKIKPGSVTDNFAMLMDLYPTFCEIADVNLNHSIDGISIIPTLIGDPQITDDRYVFWVRREGGSRYGGQAYYAARYKNFKMLQNTPYEPIQYFNLEDDEYETHPLDPSAFEEFSILKKQLQEHIRSSGNVPWQKPPK